MIKNIFFDFDGVLAESTEVKTNAFYELYLPYGKKIAEQAKQHHLENGGISRYEKIRYYHKKWLQIDLNDTELNQLAHQFSTCVKEKVIAAQEVHGAGKFLEKHKTRFRYWIISGTPEEEMKEIVSQRKMAHYFIQICGSPKNKTYWTEQLISYYKLKREQTAFLGDAITDYEASSEAALQFYLRETPTNKTFFSHYSGHRFTHYDQLERLLLS